MRVARCFTKVKPMLGFNPNNHSASAFFHGQLSRSVICNLFSKSHWQCIDHIPKATYGQYYRKNECSLGKANNHFRLIENICHPYMTNRYLCQDNSKLQPTQVICLTSSYFHLFFSFWVISEVVTFTGTCTQVDIPFFI